MTQYSVEEYAEHLRREEKSTETITKYTRYAVAFLAFLGGGEVTKEAALAFKSSITGAHTAAGANGMIAAVNSFLSYLGLGELKISSLKIQRKTFLPEEKELDRPETERLIKTAERERKPGVALAIRTMFATGARVSELQYITVEAAQAGRAEIRLKGKTRELFLQPKLCKQLLSRARELGIASGPIFVTRTGKLIDRHRIWREMKALGAKAGVLASRVFPHNLRRLFARTFFAKFPNLAALADVLGHSDVNTTRIYTAETAETHRKRLESLPLLL
ncbi:MAG: tyrosine-type recombinase/integrase [Oscillospiraceae bacterium]|jgi:integrase|nr:tyrosine-type recombinase/integrase [Oscillospiraceae bacterium]